MSYTFSVVELPAKQVAGITVQTDMQHAEQDCPVIWQTFGPRICAELSGHIAVSDNADTFGICQMIDESRFIYWAAIEVNSTENLPADMKTMTVPAGFYVTCTAPNLEKLGEAFTALYMQWPQTQNDYAIDMQGVCFELYKGQWQMNDPIQVYAAVTKKV